jgi:hypothetical protein
MTTPAKINLGMDKKKEKVSVEGFISKYIDGY